jgi:hypothetical protein
VLLSLIILGVEINETSLFTVKGSTRGVAKKFRMKRFRKVPESDNMIQAEVRMDMGLETYVPSYPSRHTRSSCSAFQS